MSSDDDTMQTKISTKPQIKTKMNVDDDDSSSSDDSSDENQTVTPKQTSKGIFTRQSPR